MAFLTLCCMTAYLLSALNPYMFLTGWWLISLLGLFFPFLLGGMIVLLAYWLFFDRRWFLACGIIVLLGTRSIFSTFAIHFFDKPAGTDLNGLIRVMSYNIREFKPETGGREGGVERFLQEIKTVRPDILCLQELNNSNKPNFMADGNVLEVKKALGMSYAFFSKDYYLFDSVVVQGSVIVTRYPVLDSGRIKLTNDAIAPHVIYADVLVKGDTLRVMTTHLQSFGLESADYADLSDIKYFRKGIISSLSHLIGKFRRVFLLQNRQAAKLAEVVRQSPHPVILCGDFNSVPNAYTYFTARGKLQDAFLKKGRGIGTTYYRLSSTLRIDYIFTDPRLPIASFRVIPKVLSDHFPVVAEIALPARSPEKRSTP